MNISWFDALSGLYAGGGGDLSRRPSILLLRSFHTCPFMFVFPSLHARCVYGQLCTYTRTMHSKRYFFRPPPGARIFRGNKHARPLNGVIYVYYAPSRSWWRSLTRGCPAATVPGRLPGSHTHPPPRRAYLRRRRGSVYCGLFLSPSRSPHVKTTL